MTLENSNQEDFSSFESEDADGANAFLLNLSGKKKPDEAAPKEVTGNEESTESEEGGDTSPEASQESESEPDPEDPDEQELEFRVGEQTQKAKLKELRDAYLAQKEINEKSQQLKANSDALGADSARISLAMKGMLERAQERYKPYAELDMLVLAQRMDTESFEQLRKDAAAAKADVDYIHNELSAHNTAHQQRQDAANRAAAQECIRVLTDPQHGIKGFGNELYTEIMNFAVGAGLTDAPRVTNPAAIKILHKAMLYDKSLSSVAKASAKLEKAPAKPSKLMTPQQGNKGQQSTKANAIKTLKSTGSVDDAADAFLASFG